MNQIWKCKLTVKHIFVTLSLAAVLLLSAIGAYSQSDPAAGSWTISSNGSAVLGAPSSGTCQVNGTTAGSLYDSFMDFSDGSITIHNLGISIGATSCTSVNFQGTGTYKVTDKGDGNFQVDATITTQFAGRGAACSGTALNNLTFTMLGKSGAKIATVTVNGFEEGSSGSYAEGPPAGPLSCSAPVLNFTGNGTATKF
jgi:hypothetical protein